jgi:hypothetical protein
MAAGSPNLVCVVTYPCPWLDTASKGQRFGSLQRWPLPTHSGHPRQHTLQTGHYVIIGNIMNDRKSIVVHYPFYVGGSLHTTKGTLCHSWEHYEWQIHCGTLSILWRRLIAAGTHSWLHTLQRGHYVIVGSIINDKYLTWLVKSTLGT